MTFIDNTIAFFSPKAGLKRMAARAAIKRMEEHERKFDASSKGRRTSGWRTNSLSANAENGPQLQKLRDVSRDLVRNNSYAFNAVETLATNIIGTGIRLTITGKDQNKVNKAKEIWKAWGETTVCDFEHDLDFYGLQSLMCRAELESGEVLVLRRKLTYKKGGVLPIRLQVIEPDHIDMSRDTAGVVDGNYIREGIEYNPDGERVAYWLYDHHPGDQFLMSVSKRVPVEEIVHIFKKTRPGQHHGVPAGVASSLRLHDLDDYEDARLMQQKIASCYAAFISDFDGENVNESEDDSDITEKIQPGRIQNLPPGKTITFAAPPSTSGHEEFRKTNLMGSAAGYGMTYETFSGDLSNTSFSSGRLGWLENQRKITDRQLNVYVPKLNKIWDWVVGAMFLQYGIKPEDLTISWTVPRREMIDVLKETQAMISQVRAGFKTWSEAVRELGYNPEEMLTELKKDIEAFKTAGVTVECLAEVPLNTGVPADGGGDGSKKPAAK